MEQIKSLKWTVYTNVNAFKVSGFLKGLSRNKCKIAQRQFIYLKYTLSLKMTKVCPV